MFGSKVCLDIETVANERAPSWFSKVEVKAPSNYKDEDKIKAYVESARNKLGSKSALTWHTGKAFSFALADINNDETLFMHSLDEVELLKTIATECAGREVYTKSGKLFDFPFLVGRFLANSVPLPAFLVQKTFQYDVDDFFSWSQSNGQRMSLDAYAHGLGITGKTGSYDMAQKLYTEMITGGSNVAKLEQELEDYNIQDVLIVREIVRRYQGIGLTC